MVYVKELESIEMVCYAFINLDGLHPTLYRSTFDLFKMRILQLFHTTG